MGIVRENHPARTQRNNKIELSERWVAKTKKRINRYMYYYTYTYSEVPIIFVLWHVINKLRIQQAFRDKEKCVVYEEVRCIINNSAHFEL